MQTEAPTIPPLTCSRFALSALAFVLLLSGAARAQKVDKEKLDVASRRSEKAAKVLNDLAALPQEEAIPRELLEKAREVLWGKPPATTTVPPALAQFQSALAGLSK